MIPTLVKLTTTAGGELHAHPERLTAVWQVATYSPPVHPSAFPGRVYEPAPERHGFQTRVEIGDGAGAFSVIESPAEVIARRDAALEVIARREAAPEAYRRGFPGRVFRIARRVRAAA